MYVEKNEEIVLGGVIVVKVDKRGFKMSDASVAAISAGTTVDVVLISIIAALLIGFLILIVIYGGSINDQLTVISQKFQTALITTEVQFGNLLANAVEVFGGLAEVAGQAFAQFVPQIVAAFTAVSSYFTDQLRAIIKQIQNNLFSTSSGLTNSVLAGMQSVGSAFTTVISQIQNFYFSVVNTLLGLVAQATMFIISLVNAIINLVVNGIATAIIFIVQGVETLITIVSQLITTGLAQIPGLIQDAENLFNGLVAAASSSLTGVLNSILAFGNTIVSTFQAIPHYTICIIRCLCSYTPLVPCPINCCCECCPGGSCGNCPGSGCCPCTDTCFFPSNCCNGQCAGICGCAS